MSLFSRAKIDRKATSAHATNLSGMTIYEDVDRVILNDYAFLNLEITDTSPIPKNSEPAVLTLAVPPTVSLESQGLTPQYDAIKEDIPPDWTICRDAKGRIYYFNIETGQSYWKGPWQGGGTYKSHVVSEFDVNSHIKINGNTTVRASMATPNQSIVRGTIYNPSLQQSQSMSSLPGSPSVSSLPMGSPEIGGLPSSQSNLGMPGGNRGTVVSDSVRATRPRMYTLLEKPDDSRRVRASTSMPDGAQPPPPTSIRASLANRPTMSQAHAIMTSTSSAQLSSAPHVIHEDNELAEDDSDDNPPPPPPLALPKRATIFPSSSSFAGSPMTTPQSTPASPLASSISSPGFSSIKVASLNSPPPMTMSPPPSAMPEVKLPPPQPTIAPSPPPIEASNSQPPPPPPGVASKRLSMMPPPPPV